MAYVVLQMRVMAMEGKIQEIGMDEEWDAI
jgi:hypothetical protein